MITNRILRLLLVLAGIPAAYHALGQPGSISPSSVSTGTFYGLTPPASTFPALTQEEFLELERKGKEEPLNDEMVENTYPYKESSLPKGPDPAWQNYAGKMMNTTTILENFQGQSSPYYPPDANGAVGHDYYVQTVNCLFAVYNKAGVLILGPVSVNYFFQGVTGSNCNSGDPVIIYDEQADRWLLAEMSLCNENDVMLVAVSETNDPSGRWYRYSFETDDMPDYEKLGVWRDGYYMGTNTVYEDLFGDPHWEGNDIYVMERSQMLNGQAAQIVAFDNPWRPVINGLHCVPPLDNEGQFAPFGSPGLFVTFNDDAISGGSDQLWIYELAVDWLNPYWSTFTRTQQINVIPFDSDFGPNWENISQAGATMKLHAVNFYIMNRPQYRNFGSYQSIVCCHSVDVDGTDHAGVRWYELRKTAGDWFIRQQGTYAPDGHCRWLGSIALNGNNEIGLAYSVSSSTLHPGIRYCGQSSSAYTNATGVMDLTEGLIQAGSYSQLSYRWGDYADLGVDPANDEIFWFTSEYIGSGYERKTKIASFFINTTALHADFSASEQHPAVNGPVEFSDLSIGGPLSWEWTISPGSLVFVGGTTATSQNPVVRFISAGNYSVKLKISGASGNDSITKSNFISICGANSLPVTEEFSSGWIPECWELHDLYGEGLSWDFTNPMGRVLNSTTSYNGIAVCDAENYFAFGEAALETPVLDLSGYSTVYLYFEHYLYIPETNPAIDGFVYFSTDGGETWVALAMWATTTSNPNYYNADVSVFAAGQSAVKFRWVYHNEYWPEGFWALDDIWIYGIPDEAPVADFYADKLTPEINNAVFFTDCSSNSPSSWSWTISPDTYYYIDETSSTSQNPAVVFYDGGFYDASLEVSNGIGSDMLAKSSYIYAITPGLWKGTISSNWNTPLNWDNTAVPDGTVTVTIPETAPNWPVFTGTHIVGIHSANLVMLGGSLLTIEGNLYNDLNRIVLSLDSALLKISGGFYNYGTLYPGTGTIEFYGDGPSEVYGTNWSDMYIMQYNWSAFVSEWSVLSGASSGPSGDDNYMDISIGFPFYYCGSAYLQMRLSTNGWCTLNQSGSTGNINEYLFTPDVPNTTLAPWWDDLYADGLSAVRYKTEGTSPDRIFTLEWYRMLTYWTSATSRISFQLKLYETSNVIEFIYGPYESGSYSIYQGASAGIDDNFGGALHFIEGTTGSVTDGISNLQSHADWPGGIGYRFTPAAVTENFYNLKLSKVNNSLYMNRDADVLNKVVVEGRSELFVPSETKLHIGQ
jgi:PKD repeat protein